MLAQVYQKNTSIKTLCPYKTVLSFMVFICASSSAQSIDSNSIYSYIDCSITAKKITTGGDDLKYTNSYRLNEKNKTFSFYNEKLNKYTSLCDLFCDIRADSIAWRTSNTEYGTDNTASITINRWNGSFEGRSAQFQNGDLKYEVSYSGVCKGGVSKFRTKPKF